MVKENKTANERNIARKFLDWFRTKSNIFTSIAPYGVAFYFLALCAIYFASIQTFITLSSTIIFALKGLVFGVFTLFFIAYYISLNKPLSKKIIVIFSFIFLFSIFAIFLNPQSRNITSIGRISISNELYEGWTYNVVDFTIKTKFSEKISALFTLITFIFSAFIFLYVLPEIFKDEKNKLKIFFLVNLFIASFVLYSFVFERSSIVEIIRNKFNSTKGVKSIFDNKNTYGLICFFGVLTSIYQLSFKNIISKVFGVGSALLCSAGLVITVCKTAIMSLLIYIFVLSILVSVFLYLKKNKVISIILTSVWVIIGLTIAAVFIVPQFSQIREMVAKIFVNYGSTTIKSRIEAWRTVFQTTNGYNVLIGFGDSIYWKYFTSSTEAITFWNIPRYLSAHNSFLEIYLIGGIFRLSLYIIVIYIAFKNCFKFKGLEKCCFVASFLAFLSCSFFESIILCDHTTLAFVPSIYLISIPLSLSKSHLLAESNVQHCSIRTGLWLFLKKNALQIVITTIIFVFSIFGGYFWFYKNYLLLVPTIVLIAFFSVALIFFVNKTKKPFTLFCDYSISIIIASLILFSCFIFNKNNSLLIGVPYSIEHNKYKDIVSVHYLGGFYPFIIVSIFLLLSTSLYVPLRRINKVNIEHYFEIQI